MINKTLPFLFILFTLFSKLFAQEFWDDSNGPYGGHSSDVIVDTDNEIFAAGNQGIFYSSDDGANWELRRIEPSPLSVTSIAIKENFLLVGTHQGLFRSSDKGISWEMIKSGSIFKINIHPITQDIFVAEYYGIYYSSDNGLTWNDIKNNLPSSQIWAFGIIQTGEIFIGFDFNGLYKSINYGLEWFRSDTGMTTSGVTAFVESSNGTLYAGRGGIFKSTDKGSNWINVYSDPFGSLRSLGSYQDSIVFAGLPGFLMKSSNYGINWDTLYESVNYNNSVRTIEINTLGEIFINVNECGLLKSIDNGSSWQKIGLPITSIRKIVQSPNGTLFATTGWEGLFRSTNSGDNWEWIDHNFDWPIYGDVIVDDSANVFCLGEENRIYRSFDNGITWDVSNFGQGINYGFFLGKNNKLFLNNINMQLYYSTDFGDNWILANSNFPGFGDYAMDSFDNIYIVIDDKLYKSIDEGITWSQINGNFPPGTFLNVISIDSYDNIYIGTGSVMFGMSSGIYYSTDYGLSWDEINTGLPDTVVVSIAINRDNLVYAALANQGVYYYDSNTNVWNPVDNSPYFNNITSLMFDNEGFLYAGTSDQSVIKSTQTTVAVDEDLRLKFDYLLDQNYPNPFNPVTSIQYTAGNRQFIVIKVYDILGKEIATLVNEEKPAGKYEVEFNGSNLPSGIYFYQLKVGDFVESKKMILLK